MASELQFVKLDPPERKRIYYFPGRELVIENVSAVCVRPSGTHRIETTYPLAPDGIFYTVQGEGALLGVPMVFVRLAGCGVGCENCDTDYRVTGRLTAEQIAARVLTVRGGARWVWVTGGEPADHDLAPLLKLLWSAQKVALATSGHKPLGPAGRRWVDFVSVSPHGTPADLVLTGGAQLNLVPGLNGLRLADWEAFDAGRFAHRYATPLYGSAESLAECLRWVGGHAGWRLGVQAHKAWGLP